MLCYIFWLLIHVILFLLGSDSVKKKFIKQSINFIKSKKKITTLEEKKLLYGLEAFYNLFTKIIVLIILAFIFDCLKELLLLTFIYSTLRIYGFGIHAKTSLQCWFTTLPIYLGGCFFIKYCELPMVTLYIIWIFSFISFLLFAPADTPARPLIHKNKRIRAKILSIIILIGYLIISIYSNNISINNAIIYGLLMECLSINPVIYKLFNTPFNNYKYFQKTTV